MKTLLLPRLRPVSFRASSLWRLIACPGSADLESRCPVPPGGDDALIGTMGHRVGEVALERRVTAEDLLGETLTCKVTDENGKEVDVDFEVTVDLIDLVSVYVDYVLKVIGENPGALLFIELDIGVEYQDQNRENFEIGSHADAVVLVPGVFIQIIDFKSGRVQVAAFENAQLIQYLIGTISKISSTKEDLGLTYPDWYPKEARLTIVQPNSFSGYEVETWTVSDLPALFQRWVPMIKNLVFSADHNAGVYRMGKQCHWCPGVSYCPAVWDATNAFSEMRYEDMYALDPKKIATLLEQLPGIKKLTQNLEDVALRHCAFRGARFIPGFKRVKVTRTFRSFKPSAPGALLMEGFDDSDLYTQPKLISPAQVEALAKKRKWKIDIDEIVSSQVKEYHYIVPMSDPRPIDEDDFDSDNFNEPHKDEVSNYDDLID